MQNLNDQNSAFVPKPMSTCVALFQRNCQSLTISGSSWNEQNLQRLASPPTEVKASLDGKPKAFNPECETEDRPHTRDDSKLISPPRMLLRIFRRHKIPSINERARLRRKHKWKRVRTRSMALIHRDPIIFIYWRITKEVNMFLSDEDASKTWTPQKIRCFERGWGSLEKFLVKPKGAWNSCECRPFKCCNNFPNLM